jgi:hypothetical protein
LDYCFSTSLARPQAWPRCGCSCINQQVNKALQLDSRIPLKLPFVIPHRVAIKPLIIIIDCSHQIMTKWCSTVFTNTKPFRQQQPLRVTRNPLLPPHFSNATRCNPTKQYTRSLLNHSQMQSHASLSEWNVFLSSMYVQVSAKDAKRAKIVELPCIYIVH